MLSIKSISSVNCSLLDLPLLSAGYDIDEYLANHLHSDIPLIISAISNVEFNEHDFQPTINGDDLILDILANHPGNVNHAKNQFPISFRSSNVDKTVTSFLNPYANLVELSSISSNPHNNNKQFLHHIISHTPYETFNKQIFTSGNA